MDDPVDVDIDVASTIGVTVCVFTLCLIYCMLFFRRGPRDPERLLRPFRSFQSASRSSLPFRSSSIAIRSIGSSRSARISPSMFQRAIDKHAQKHAASTSTAQASLNSSSNAEVARGVIPNPGYRNPLKPRASSRLNGPSSVSQPPQRTGGIKRTLSGLTKISYGSFEDTLGSQQMPITLDDKSPSKGKVIQIAPDDFVDENDFDSDVDLDIEEPVAKYPILPPQRVQECSTKPIIYPTLPRQQQMQTSFEYSEDRSHNLTTPSRLQGTLQSSAPLPWSSSPAEHLRPSLILPAGNTEAGSSNGDAHVNERIGSLASQPQLKKKRVLPWETDPTANESKHQSHDSATRSHGIVSKSASSVIATPKDKGSANLWNTTASAVKEQQKLHREQNKKAAPIPTEFPGDAEPMRKAKTSRGRLARVFLSEEQQHVLDLVVEKKKSVFFTGSAGTGKSVLMREIISKLRARYAREPDRVAVTASTGLAASNVGGVTLHSFAGIGLGKEAVPELVKKIKKNQKARHRWMRTKILVIDEVSMVDGELFDKLESVARQIRNNGRPFGGIQLVITGDFFQLPPVPDQGRVAKFAFDAATWATTVEHTIGLHHVFRQKDPVFATMLNEMREGRLTQESISTFQKMSRPLKFEDQLECTELYPRREDVDKANFERLHNLQGELYYFEARDGGAIADKTQRDKLLSNCMAPELISLKKGAQVMLIKNVDESLVNGSLGQVMGLMDEQQFDRYSVDDSEAQKMDGGSAGGLQGRRLLDHVSSSRKYPVVRFLIADGTTRDLLCQPESWKVELPNGEVQASRSQIPLILAWALSIHKAQGQTLDRVKVDLGKVFEKGQAYVALSRATSMDGLQVLRFDPKKVVAHDRVRHFYANLSRVELDSKKSARNNEGSKTKQGIDATDYEKMFVQDDWAELP